MMTIEVGSTIRIGAITGGTIADTRAMTIGKIKIGIDTKANVQEMHATNYKSQKNKETKTIEKKVATKIETIVRDPHERAKDLVPNPSNALLETRRNPTPIDDNVKRHTQIEYDA